MHGEVRAWARACRTACVAAMLFGLPAQAQRVAPPSRSTGETIVVTGVAPDKASPREDQVRALTRAISPRVGPDQPLARFSDPICIATAGLQRNVLQAIGNRMAFDAVQAGISLAGDGCDPNVLVLFADDGRAELTALVKRRPVLFDGLTPAQIQALLDAPGPVHAWARSEIRNRDGGRLDYSANGPANLRVPIASMIVLPTRRDLISTVVVIDRKAVAGRSPDQVADYAAMRTLATVRPQGAAGSDTILTLFDPGTATPPGTMTLFDRGYLKGLYAGAANLRAPDKLAMIARHIVDAGAPDTRPSTTAAPAGR